MHRLKIQKIHLDYIAGILSIPVLLTAIIINFGNLSKNTKQTVTPTPQVVIVTGAPSQNTQQTAATPQVCKKSIGPISISYPQEGQTVSDNPVCITINYSDSDYCSVVWSYQINNGSWSDFNNNAPCLYNLPNGNIRFQLRVNSTVSNDTATLTRNFTYAGTNSPVASPTPTNIPLPTPTTVPALTSVPTTTPTPTSTTGQ